MSQVHILGLTGHAGAGKDTCAGILTQHGFLTIAFADALRKELCEAFYVDGRIFSDRVVKEQPLASLAIGMCRDPAFVGWAIAAGKALEPARSPRWLMQQWGTEFRRARDPLYWVRPVEGWLRRQIGSGRKRLVITDVRMPNEAWLITQQYRGALVRIHRPGLAPTADPKHQSEQHSVLQADADLHNVGTLDHLENECTRILQSLGVLPNAHTV